MSGPQGIADAMQTRGFVLVPAEGMRPLAPDATGPTWATFVDSWNDLPPDQHMADGGRYRRRRFACFTTTGRDMVREQHQAHFQHIVYNQLNGGVQRWFAPVTDALGVHPVTTWLVTLGAHVFSRAACRATPPTWRVEMHQFRIEARSDLVGMPTPEGMHRDGVDWVLVTLVSRANVEGGVTALESAEGTSLGSFTLSDPLDTVFLDDRRVTHGVTPILALVPSKEAHRDVLVLTYREMPGGQQATVEESRREGL